MPPSAVSNIEVHTMEPQGSPAYSATQLRHFEQRLMEEREQAVRQMARFGDELGQSQEEAAGELTTWRFHMADVGTETYEREQSFMLASREGQLLWHIDEALRRLYRTPERFGRCDECGSVIAYERLDAIPYVPRCHDCKQDWEVGSDTRPPRAD